MKIICIGRNYGEHIRELANEVPEEPVIFMKPDTALLRNGQDFYLPSFSADIHHEIEVIVRISRPGKNIQSKFASKYYQELSLGIDFTAREKQAYLKGKGLPWELAKAFDGSAAVGNMIAKDRLDLAALEFRLEKNGTVVQNGNIRDMIHSIDEMVSFVSTYFTLKTGDILFTGTPAGVGPVQAGDLLKGYIKGMEEAVLDIRVK